MSLSKIERIYSEKRITLDSSDVELIAELCNVSSDVVSLSKFDSPLDKVVSLSAKGRLDRSPKSNWVEKAGGLPKKIEDLAVELHKKGHSIQNAIQIAVGRAKVFAVTVKDPAKKAEWQAAVAQWEKMKKSTKAKKKQ